MITGKMMGRERRDLKFQDLRFEIDERKGMSKFKSKSMSKKRCRDLSFADIVRPHPIPRTESTPHPAQWLPKPATIQVPRMKRSLRDPWSSLEEERDSLRHRSGVHAQRLALGNSLLAIRGPPGEGKLGHVGLGFERS